MSVRDDVLRWALNEAVKPVAWSTDEKRIFEYFAASTGKPDWTKEECLAVSWCSYFVHWVLLQAKANPTPKVGMGKTLGKMGSIGRFMKSFGGVYADHPVVRKSYRPQPGDMYYLPDPHDHIGFVAGVRDVSKGRYEIDTVDGNSGPMGASPLFDRPGMIGKNFIYKQTRRLPDNAWYVELPSP